MERFTPAQRNHRNGKGEAKGGGKRFCYLTTKSNIQILNFSQIGSGVGPLKT